MNALVLIRSQSHQILSRGGRGSSSLFALQRVRASRSFLLSSRGYSSSTTKWASEPSSSSSQNKPPSAVKSSTDDSSSSKANDKGSSSSSSSSSSKTNDKSSSSSSSSSKTNDKSSSSSSSSSTSSSKSNNTAPKPKSKWSRWITLLLFGGIAGGGAYYALEYIDPSLVEPIDSSIIQPVKDLLFGEPAQFPPPSSPSPPYVPPVNIVQKREAPTPATQRAEEKLDEVDALPESTAVVEAEEEPTEHKEPDSPASPVPDQQPAESTTKPKVPMEESEEDRIVREILESKEAENAKPVSSPELDALKGSENYQRFRELLELQEEAHKLTLQRALLQKDEEWANQLEELRLRFKRYHERSLQRQKEEIEIAVDEFLHQKEAEISQAIELKLRSAEQYFSNELQKQLNFLDDVYHQKHLHRLENLQRLVDTLEANHQTLQQLWKQERLNAQLFALSSAVMRLSISLSTRKPLTEEFQVLKAAATGQELILQAVDAVPARAIETGVYSQEELKRFFEEVHHRVRPSFVSGEKSGLLWQFFGEIISRLPIADRSASLSGDEFARAKFFLERDDLLNAVKELETLPESTQKQIKDWTSAVEDHLIVQQTLRVAQSQVLTMLHAVQK